MDFFPYLLDLVNSWDVTLSIQENCLLRGESAADVALGKMRGNDESENYQPAVVVKINNMFYCGSVFQFSDARL